LGTVDGVDKTPQWAETICGVPAETITEFARLYARCKPVNLKHSLVPRPSVLWRERHQGGDVPAGADRKHFNPGATASAETSCEFGQHELSLPKPVVDWQKKTGTYQAPALLAHFK